MKIASWNVNGLRACVDKGFMRWLQRERSDCVGLQETRVTADKLPASIRRQRSYELHLVSAARAGYSGVAMLTRREPDTVIRALGIEKFDAEGRFLEARFGALRVVNSYFPNGNGKNRDLSRIPYKLGYYRALFEYLRPGLEGGQPILLLGDFNTAHQPIDIARPKENEKNSGFRPEERAELSRWLQNGWVDTFRALHPDQQMFSWWCARPGVREKNLGWRIDYVLATPRAFSFVRAAEVHTRIKGSDHCPISVDVDDSVVDGP